MYSTFLLYVSMCQMEKGKSSKELSEDFRIKIVEKHEESQGYKSISRDLNVSVSTVRNIVKFTAHGTVATVISLDVDKREKCIKDCNEGLFEWWMKNLDQLPEG